MKILVRYPQATLLAYIVAFCLCGDVVWSCSCDVGKLTAVRYFLNCLFSFAINV